MEPVLPGGRLGEFNEVNGWGGINGFALQNNQSVDSISETSGERKAVLVLLLPWLCPGEMRLARLQAPMDLLEWDWCL